MWPIKYSLRKRGSVLSREIRLLERVAAAAVWAAMKAITKIGMSMKTKDEEKDSEKTSLSDSEMR